MKTLDKYIFTQVLGAAIVALLLFIIIWICPEILFKIIKKLVYGEVTLPLAMKLLAFEIPEVIGKSISVGLMLGCLFVFDKLSRDFELTIFRSIGISFGRIVIPVVVLGLLGSIISYFLNTSLIPNCNETLKEMKNDTYASHFVYVDKDKDGIPNEILIIGWYDGEYIGNAKLIEFSHSQYDTTPTVSSISTAYLAEYNKTSWTLLNGMEYKIASNGVYKDVEKFYKKNILTPKASENAYKLLKYSTQKSREMANVDLKEYLSLLKDNGLDDEYKYMQSKYYQRFAHPFSCLLLALCGVVLGFNRPREKRVWGFTAGVGIIFLYFVLIPFMDVLSQYGVLSPAIAAWIPNIILFLLLMIIVKIKQI